MTAFGAGGYGVQNSDPNLTDKISALKKKRKSPTDKVQDFLEHDLGVDPKSLPFSLDQAKEHLFKITENMSIKEIRLNGNSMGLKSMAFVDDGEEIDIPCPNCGQTAEGGYWAQGLTEWYCYDEETSYPATHPGPSRTVHTEKDSKLDWHDVKRMYNAFVAYVHEGDDPLADLSKPVYTFTATRSWGGVEVQAVPAAPVNPDPASYPTGAVLRLMRHVINSTEEPELLYVRIGGLFNDTDVTILESMKPIPDLTGWAVVEEL